MGRDEHAKGKRSKSSLPLTPDYAKTPPGKVDEEFSHELSQVDKLKRKNAHYNQKPKNN